MSEDHEINAPPFGTELQPIDFVRLAETCAEAPAGGFPYLACQSGEQSSIGFQPVSSVDCGWLAVLSGPPISACLDEKSKSVGGSIQAGSLCCGGAGARGASCSSGGLADC
jgi:hypothetical protein